MNQGEEKKVDSGANMAAEKITEEQFRPILDELMEEIKKSIHGDGEKPPRGDWSVYPGYLTTDIFDAVSEEFDEYREAYVRWDVVGDHGQIAELLDVAVTAVKGVRRLRQIFPADF